MAMKKYLIFALLIVSNYTIAEAYLGKDLSSWPQNDSRKVVNDFGAWLLVTPDLNWQEKWDTPPDTIPYFNEADTVRVGDKLVILTFFTNPSLDEQRNAEVKCTLSVKRPDGTMSVSPQKFDCLNGNVSGNPRYVMLSPAVIMFTAEESDPAGIWTVYVTLEDRKRRTLIELKTTYNLIKSNG